MRVVVFLHGTVLMHAAAEKVAREERVRQSQSGSGYGLHEFDSYVPIGNAPQKLRKWAEQSAHLAYLSSHRNANDVAADEAVLERHAFPSATVAWRRGAEGYAEVVERLRPDILVEDDCESIGAGEIAYWQLRPTARERVGSIIVPEFGGIDHLPDSLASLAAIAAQRAHIRQSP